MRPNQIRGHLMNKVSEQFQHLINSLQYPEYYSYLHKKKKEIGFDKFIGTFTQCQCEEYRVTEIIMKEWEELKTTYYNNIDLIFDQFKKSLAVQHQQRFIDCNVVDPTHASDMLFDASVRVMKIVDNVTVGTKVKICFRLNEIEEEYNAQLMNLYNAVKGTNL